MEKAYGFVFFFTDSKLYPYSGIRKNQKLDVYAKQGFRRCDHYLFIFTLFVGFINHDNFAVVCTVQNMVACYVKIALKV